MERSLFIRVVEARLMPPISPKVSENNTPVRLSSNNPNAGGHYVEILLDGETRARTMAKSEGQSPFWREEFEFLDLPAVLSTASLLLKRRPPSHPRGKDSHDTQLSSDSFLSDSAGGITGISFDQTCGKSDIYLDDLGPNQEIEKWWPLVNMYGNSVGEVLVKVSTEECVILMARDYQPMSELLHRFENGLTLQIAQMVPNELRRLSEYLLNIFQVSGQAMKWITSLVEEEIDGTLKETPASRLRFSKRLGSTDSNESGNFGSNSDRELFVRDMGNNAKLEANLLFRGNTLLTKALDFHMKRLGKEYLEETLSEKLREINDRDYECEVDPNKIEGRQELERNWRRLINLTEEIWRAIYSSVSRCPQELRLIFRHISACAEDRYGDFLRTVKYSSVSGFLFLRFFVPAVLNPKLFGLLKDHPKARARRTLTLIAKSLQGLANMSSFGTKEAWMEPMNTFLTSHRQEFKTYLDNICSISSSTSPAPPIPPSYSTPLAILQRLPPTSREGFPSLPYLVDHARNFAALVDLWLDHTQTSAPNIQATDGDLLKFHQICVSLHERTSDCLNRAERAERPSSTLSVKWEELVEQLQGSASFDSNRGKATRSRLRDQSALSDVAASSPTSPASGNGDTFRDGRDGEGDDSSEGTSTPLTLRTSSKTSQTLPRTTTTTTTSTSTTTTTTTSRPYHGHSRHHAPSLSASQSSINSSRSIPNPFSRKETRLAYTPSEANTSASASAAEDIDTESETPPGSADGMHFPPHPPFVYPNPSTSATSFSTHANVPLDVSHLSTDAGSGGRSGRSMSGIVAGMGMGGVLGRPPRSAGGQSMEGSEAGSDEFTTALPRFDKERDRDRKERGLQKILPFKSRRREKEREKDRDRKDRERDRDRSKDRDRNKSADRSNGSALGDYRRDGRDAGTGGGGGGGGGSSTGDF
jgi:hypothetical protein